MEERDFFLAENNFYMTFLEKKTYRYVKTEHTYFVFQAFFSEIEFQNSITGRI